MILLEQIRTIDKRRLREKIGRIDDGLMASVNNAVNKFRTRRFKNLLLRIWEVYMDRKITCYVA